MFRLRALLSRQDGIAFASAVCTPAVLEGSTPTAFFGGVGRAGEGGGGFGREGGRGVRGVCGDGMGWLGWWAGVAQRP